MNTVDQSDSANVDLLQTLLYEAAAGVGIVVGQLLFDLRNAQTVGNQLVWVDANLVFAGGTTEAGNVDDVGTALKFFSTTQSSSDFSSIASYAGLVLCSVKK